MVRTSRTFDVIFLGLLAVVLVWAAINRVAVGDWVYFLSYQPPGEVVQIADEAGMTKDGRQLFYRTHPQFLSRAEIVAECDLERLGCLNEKGWVFILKEGDNHDQVLVTAAHEMLHLAYQRLPQAEKQRLAPLLDEGIRRNSTLGIDEELAAEATEADRQDEAHSLLGTEYRDLPDDLESYYQRYFQQRTNIVAAEERSRRK